MKEPKLPPLFPKAAFLLPEVRDTTGHPELRDTTAVARVTFLEYGGGVYVVDMTPDVAVQLIGELVNFLRQVAPDE